MSTVRSTTLLVSAALAVAACDPAADTTADAARPIDAAIDAGDNGTTDVTLTRVGNPAWETVGWELVATPSWDDNFEVWSHHVYQAANNTFVPGPAHAGPYDAEIRDALARLGFDPGRVFSRADWTAPRNLIAFGVIVPSATAPIGSTPDYPSGPYIPGDLAIHVDGDLFYLADLVDPAFDSDYPTLRQTSPTLAVDGSSHLPLTFGEDTSFVPGTPGPYSLVVKLTEVAAPQHGWTIVIRFRID